MFAKMEVKHNLVFSVLLWTSVFQFTYELNEMCADFGLNSEEIIRKHNYAFEKHIVQTEDGYLLEVHRILPNIKFRNKTIDAKPILIYSGLMGDSSTWVSLGPKKGLGFILADHGYDVWLGNNRGSTLCKSHVYLDQYKDKKKFWNFSLQELSYYDIPATIDYVLNVTKQEKLLYMGYSQSTTCYFAMLSEKPNYKNKIKFAIALAPATSIPNTLSIAVKVLLQNQIPFKRMMESLEVYELLSHSTKFISQLVRLCSPNSNILKTCTGLICISFGGTMAQINQSTVPLILNNSPAGASLNQALHFLQLANGNVQKFDYGESGNLENYGQAHPPLYNLSEVQVPTAIIYGSYDILTSQKVKNQNNDVELLAPQLPNLVGMTLIPKFNHIDLSLGDDAPTLVFPEILNYLKLYS